MNRGVPGLDIGGILLYQTEDGRTRIECRFAGETLWLSQSQMAALFQTTPQNITLHLKAIYREGELTQEATCKDYLQVREEGARTIRRKLLHYNLDAVLAVGYRVRSHRGTQFRRWATDRLREYLVKGFAMDDERLKNPPGRGQVNYFDELLARVRDIRSSERVFWRKVLDLYATSIDYAPSSDLSQQFFATVQNKMHWAAHGHTAAELVVQRADAAQPFMGLRTTRPGGVVRREDVSIAKNYLDAEELEALNRIVSAYLEFAEVQALSRRPMTMRDWIGKLDDFLKLTERALLDHAGKVSAETARLRAEAEYDRYRIIADADPQPVDFDFERSMKLIEQQSKRPKLTRRRGKK
jgi:hypothetical protein